MSNYKVGYFVGSLSTSSINRLLEKALVRLAPLRAQASGGHRYVSRQDRHGHWAATRAQYSSFPVRTRFHAITSTAR